MAGRIVLKALCIAFAAAPLVVAGVPGGGFHAAAAERVAAGAGAYGTGVSIAAATKRKRRVLLVGPTRSIKTPSEAARVAQKWDHIKIDSGTYRDCAVWRVGGLILEGVGPKPAHVTNAICDDQAIWLIRADNITIVNMEFSKAHSSYNNGAGVKMLGNHLLVRNSYFHDNENGILTGRFRKSYVVIDKSKFERNGACRPDCAHGIYIGHVFKLVVRGSEFVGQNEGHHIKSRALFTEISSNRIVDGPDGTASMSIDLPNGGTADISYNYVEQGPKAMNSSLMVSIGEESVPRKNKKAMPMNPSRGLVFRNNVFTNDHPNKTAFIRNATNVPITLVGNSFVGPGEHVRGPVRNRGFQPAPQSR